MSSQRSERTSASVTGPKTQRLPSGVSTIGTEIVWPHPGGDPRARFPAIDAQGVFTARRIHRWLTERRCLCGCGRRVQWLHSREGEGYSYFNRHCWAKVARAAGLVAPNAMIYPARRDPRWLESVRRENEARLCSVEDTAWYINMVLADIEDRKMSYRGWSLEKGLGEQYVTILLKTLKAGGRIKKYTAGTILKALGERLPADIKDRYETRQRSLRKQDRARREALAS